MASATCKQLHTYNHTTPSWPQTEVAHGRQTTLGYKFAVCQLLAMPTTSIFFRYFVASYWQCTSSKLPFSCSDVTMSAIHEHIVALRPTIEEILKISGTAGASIGCIQDGEFYDAHFGFIDHEQTKTANADTLTVLDLCPSPCWLYCLDPLWMTTLCPGMRRFKASVQNFELKARISATIAPYWIFCQ
jgi:hypothetical protein